MLDLRDGRFALESFKKGAGQFFTYILIISVALTLLTLGTVFIISQAMPRTDCADGEHLWGSTEQAIEVEGKLYRLQRCHFCAEERAQEIPFTQKQGE